MVQDAGAAGSNADASVYMQAGVEATSRAVLVGALACGSEILSMIIWTSTFVYIYIHTH